MDESQKPASALDEAHKPNEEMVKEADQAPESAYKIPLEELNAPGPPVIVSSISPQAPSTLSLKADSQPSEGQLPSVIGLLADILVIPLVLTVLAGPLFFLVASRGILPIWLVICLLIGYVVGFVLRPSRRHFYSFWQSYAYRFGLAYSIVVIAGLIGGYMGYTANGLDAVQGREAQLILSLFFLPALILAPVILLILLFYKRVGEPTSWFYKANKLFRIFFQAILGGTLVAAAFIAYIVVNLTINPPTE